MQIPPNEETARFVMALLLWALVTEIVTVLMLFEIPAANREILVGLAGTIVGALVGSANFYNKSGITNDRLKDDTISKLTTTAASIQAATQPEPTVVLAEGDVATVAARGTKAKPKGTR